MKAEIDQSELAALDTSNIIPRSRRQSAINSGLVKPNAKPTVISSNSSSSNKGNLIKKSNKKDDDSEEEAEF